ncbi:MAG TPA: outer membrane beta-barrel protein [Candidatus Eisenbacteria bacterium]|nr:outer membrane beta-barrel protein [Candidatus Eisenbacteria bacterium]
MKRSFALVLLALAIGAGAAQAAGPTIGVGPYGGYNIALIQQDTGNGAVFGARVPVNLIPLITLEPFYATSNLGDVTETFGGLSYTRTGFDMKAFGTSAILGSLSSGGLKFYPYAGIGSYKMTRTGSDDIKETGYKFGLGIGVPAGPKISVQLRGGLDMIKTGDTSRKFANATIGINYTVLSGK